MAEVVLATLGRCSVLAVVVVVVAAVVVAVAAGRNQAKEVQRRRRRARVLPGPTDALFRAQNAECEQDKGPRQSPPERAAA